jgi:hypothetical protein
MVCYLLHLSTSSEEDLSARSDELIQYAKPIGMDDLVTARLLHSHKWFVAAPSSCSCGLRHLMQVEFGFSKPVDWYPEDEENIKATLRFVRTIRKLREAGHSVDCIDAWVDSTGEGLIQMKVRLAALTDDEFRFFENYHFLFE